MQVPNQWFSATKPARSKACKYAMADSLLTLIKSIMPLQPPWGLTPMSMILRDKAFNP